MQQCQEMQIINFSLLVVVETANYLLQIARQYTMHATTVEALGKFEIDALSIKIAFQNIFIKMAL